MEVEVGVGGQNEKIKLWGEAAKIKWHLRAGMET